MPGLPIQPGQCGVADETTNTFETPYKYVKTNDLQIGIVRSKRSGYKISRKGHDDRESLDRNEGTHLLNTYILRCRYIFLRHEDRQDFHC